MRKQNKVALSYSKIEYFWEYAFTSFLKSIINKEETKKINTEHIKLLRDQLGISQEEMAEKMAMSQTAYSRFETGETKLDFERLVKLSNMLNADPLTLVKSIDKNITLNNSNHNVVSDYIDHQYMMVDKELLCQLSNTVKLLSELIDKLKH